MGNKSYSKAISWFDDCRIPFVDDGDKGVFNKNSEGINRQKNSNVMETYMNNSYILGNHNIDDNRQQGRFPANLLVCDDMLNDGVITKVQDNLKEKTKQYKGGNFGGGSVKNNFYFGDKSSNSRYYNIDKWFNNLIDE